MQGCSGLHKVPITFGNCTTSTELVTKMESHRNSWVFVSASEISCQLPASKIPKWRRRTGFLSTIQVMPR
jgi:hypothetical protein